MNFDFDLAASSFPILLIGALVTIKITAISVALGVVIGLVVGVARISQVKPLRLLVHRQGTDGGGALLGHDVAADDVVHHPAAGGQARHTADRQ